MVSEFLVRMGTFSILVGLGIFILFVASDAAGKADFDYLFWALLAIVMGILLRGRKEPAAPSGRFGFLRRFQNPPRDRRDRK
jgi:hypothetical protein